ncbi:DUF3572 domain-containing protein [Geitlerinema splendidum]|nr:DUF3572 domain-containing protein [Geitlerinema splendidum]
MDKEKAEIIALQALSFIVRDDDLLERFLTNSGLTPDELKERVREPDFLGGILDEILCDDKDLLNFCNLSSLSPETIILARRALPGGFTLE